MKIKICIWIKNLNSYYIYSLLLIKFIIEYKITSEVNLWNIKFNLQYFTLFNNFYLANILVLKNNKNLNTFLNILKISFKYSNLTFTFSREVFFFLSFSIPSVST